MLVYTFEYIYIHVEKPRQNGRKMTSFRGATAARPNYVCMYFCVYFCMCVCVRARVDVHMHSCRRILFICTVQSLYYMCVYHRCFCTLACVCVGGLEVGFVSAFSWLALVTGVGGYVLAGVEIGV